MAKKDSYEYIIIGSGFGGSFAAYNLAMHGREVLIIERGKPVKRDDTCWDENALHLKDHLYRGETPNIINQQDNKIDEDWPNDTIGGMSTFYGAAAFRMKEEDFYGAPMPEGGQRDKSSAWPFTYNELAPFYQEAEELQCVAGQMGEDITEPPREKGFPQPHSDFFSPPSKIIWDTSLKKDLHPFRLPLAINFDGKSGREKCILCSTCDHYLCKLEAKNDLTVTVLPEAIKNGAEILANTRVCRINVEKNSASSVDVIDQATGKKETLKAKRIIVSCGALSTPHLLLSSGIDAYIDSGSLVGRYLMRHANGVVTGLFFSKINPDRCFHKQVGIPDYYFGDPENKSKVPGALGMIQEIHTPGKGIIRENSPFGLKTIAVISSDYLINLLCITEDMPQYDNRVFIDAQKTDKFNMPILQVFHRYTKRDIQARGELYKKAKSILKEAGAHFFHITDINTFSHAFGTCRFGNNRNSSVINPECMVWGIKNLYVLDSSFMPSGGAVNPSLTIAANALRVSKLLAEKN